MIEILDVTILDAANKRTKNERLHSAIQFAVDHARGRKWADRPTYEQGLAAWEMWANALYNIAVGKLVSNGFIGYTTSITASARLAASRYLKARANGDELLLHAARLYARQAQILTPMWQVFDEGNMHPSDYTGFAIALRECSKMDTQAVELLEKWLEEN